ncbi:hypothetical protein SO802_010812 [Lithocarpus litseifolius]|uniref:Disease resistance N-terminal domain-containing protein n=1 Tax=Lithocarpus litseifolius TaxID=425828 RepID=A0AAW2DJF3_9ROSI
MAEIAVNLVISKLMPLLSEEANLLLGVHKEVAEIKYELEYIQAFIKDADAMAEKEDRSNVVKLWVKQVLEVAERMEDVIEEYKFCVTQLQDDQPLRFKGLLQKVPYQVKVDVAKRAGRVGFGSDQSGLRSNGSFLNESIGLQVNQS